MKPGHRPGWPGWATNTLREMAREGKGAREIAAALNVGVRKFSYDAVKRRAGRVGVAIRKANRGRAFNIVRIFHRRHVTAATDVADLLKRAIRGKNLGMTSGKINTRLIYEDDDLLQRALEMCQ